jgi:hypothetical protein
LYLFIGLSDGAAKCPDRKRLFSLIKDRYAAKIQMIMQKCQAATCYCLTADIWSKFHRSFLGVTIHWLNKELVRESAVLTVQRFKGLHDFEKITEMLLQIFAKFRLDKEKISCIVTDNGSNFVKAFKENGVTFVAETDDYGEDESAEDEFSDDDENPEREKGIISVNMDSLLYAQLPHHERCASHTLSLSATTDLEKVCSTDLYNNRK